MCNTGHRVQVCKGGCHHSRADRAQPVSHPFRFPDLQNEHNTNTLREKHHQRWHKPVLCRSGAHAPCLPPAPPHRYRGRATGTARTCRDRRPHMAAGGPCSGQPPPARRSGLRTKRRRGGRGEGAGREARGRHPRRPLAPGVGGRGTGTGRQAASPPSLALPGSPARPCSSRRRRAPCSGRWCRGGRPPHGRSGRAARRRAGARRPRPARRWAPCPSWRRRAGRSAWSRCAAPATAASSRCPPPGLTGTPTWATRSHTARQPRRPHRPPRRADPPAGRERGEAAAAAATAASGTEGDAGTGTGSGLPPRRLRHHIARPEEERRRQEGGPSPAVGGLPGGAGGKLAPPRPRPEATGRAGPGRVRGLLRSRPRAASPVRSGCSSPAGWGVPGCCRRLWWEGCLAPCEMRHLRLRID